MADIFISYKRSERSQVEKIATLLLKENLNIWFDAKLEVGRDEGFQAQIEREVTSAACVLVCWTPEASKSIWVKSEAIKGMERNVLVPVYLSKCSLPLPFNAVDTADLSNWDGDVQSMEWIRVVEIVKTKVEAYKADAEQRQINAAAVYDNIKDKVYPGILQTLVQRVAALHELDRDKYKNDIKAILEWLAAIAAKELNYVEEGYERAHRQAGGDVWYFWEKGGAAAMGKNINELRKILADIDFILAKSQTILNYPAP